jgi:hypothetical protein
VAPDARFTEKGRMMRQFKEPVKLIDLPAPNAQLAANILRQMREFVIETLARLEQSKVPSAPVDVRIMNAKIETLRQVALSCEGECLDLRRFVPEIALVMEGRLGFDREPDGRVIWIVAEPTVTWAVSMPADFSDIDALRAATGGE